MDDGQNDARLEKKKHNSNTSEKFEDLPEGEVDRKAIGDSIYQVLSGHLSTVAREIMVEIELPDNEEN